MFPSAFFFIVNRVFRADYDARGNVFSIKHMENSAIITLETKGQVRWIVSIRKAVTSATKGVRNGRALKVRVVFCLVSNPTPTASLSAADQNHNHLFFAAHAVQPLAIIRLDQLLLSLCI